MSQTNVIKNLTTYLGFALEQSTLAKMHSLSDGNRRQIEEYLDHIQAFDGENAQIPKEASGSKHRKMFLATFKNYIRKTVPDFDKFLLKEEVIRTTA